jgi:two-component system, cell cycle sensor histidine kinase and response regulator CckA
MPEKHRGPTDRVAELEAELQRSRVAFQNLLERAPFGVHRYELDAGGRLVFAGANAVADRILGIEHSRLVGKTIEDAFAPLASTPIPDAYRRVAESGGVYEDEQVRYQDDRIIGAFEIHAFQTAPRAVAIMFRDITERRRAEVELAAKTRELDAYFTSSLDLLCIADTSGYFRRVNPQWEKTLGWSVTELEGRQFRDLVHPDDLPATIEAASRLASQEQILNFINRYRCKDGSYRWIEWRSIPRGETIFAVARDITDRITMESRLRRNEERLQSIFRAAPVGIGVVVDRVIVEANDRLCAMTGYARDELLGRSARLLYPDQEEFDRVGRVKYAEIHDHGTGSVETRWRRKDGTGLVVILSSTPLVPEDLHAGVTFTALDVTGRRRAEEEQHRLETRMQQTQKLESLGVLAGGIAHDFNNILMAVLGHADLAQAELPGDSSARGHIVEIERASRRAADLCRQMLAYSGKGRFVVKALDFSEVIREMLPMLEVSISKKALLRLELAAGLPPVEADVAQLRQVVMNLVINASEAIGESSGVIRLGTGVVACDAGARGGAWIDEKLAGDPCVYLDVTDTGCGMDEATRERIFEPFFSTKFTGRGLGLAAVMGIVRGHHGAIRVHSEPGRGSTFRVLLPASAQAVEHLGDTGGTASSWRGSGCVLLVDDEEDVRRVAAAMLGWLGFSVVAASDGREAVALVAEDPGRFACVLMDFTMPGMDGEETFRELRRLRPDLRVLLTSGYNEQEAVQRFVGMGLAGFIQKPYILSTLADRLRAALEA